MNPDDPLPLLPYAGTSGWAGSETSRERAERDDGSGETSARQRAVLSALDRRGLTGATWAEIADDLGLHHGQASGALSVLHHAGRIARLRERRGRSLVYVSLRSVAGRPISAPGRISGSAAPTSISPGTLPVILPADLVSQIAECAPNEPISLPRDIAEQIRSACLDALSSDPDSRSESLERR